MADDSILFSLYRNQRYGVKYNQNHFKNNKNLYPDYMQCDWVENEYSRRRSERKKRKYNYCEPAHPMTPFLHSKHSNELCTKYGLHIFKHSNNMDLVLTESGVLKKKPFKKLFTVNVTSEYFGKSDPFHNASLQANMKIYRCQLSTKEESCCCSCNSDAMFEVMKSLYDCYKKKNCNNCNCILCGHLPREERRLGEARKSVGAMKTTKEKAKAIKAALAEMEGKSPIEKEKILKDLAMTGSPLPKGRTPSEEELINKVRTEFGLPPQPKPAAEPDGRTSSEKAWQDKVKASVNEPSVIPIPSQKLRNAKAAGLITPLIGKSPEQKEKILKGLVEHGIPLPDGNTPSEMKLIDKVRKDLGIPPKPKSSSAKKKYNEAFAAGLITPLEGKTENQKEKILKAQADFGLSLPKGRTSSEKALIDKVKASAGAQSVINIPSEKLRKARAAGLLTPLKGKTHEQKEKILKGLVEHGIPLPDGNTPSEMKLIDKVRKDLGIPPKPKSSSAKKKYNEAFAAGLITPLEGKTENQKEKILKAQADFGLSLPKGRTSSEKALIDKVKASAGAQSVINIPSEKLLKARAAGLLTPLKGKTHEQKEKILKGLVEHGIPLPDGNTPSEMKLIDKVQKDLGIPPKPKSSSAKKKYNEAFAAGLITPLEGKTENQKEKILKAQADFGLSLPKGRTLSEKALVDKVKGSVKTRSVVHIPSEKLRKAKAAGLITPLTGKTSEQKEKILRGLAVHGIPLPEGKTSSETKLIDKIRKDMGLPPEPKTSSAKDKYKDALAAGIITPLQGKTAAQKEKILKAQADFGVALPEGRTSSEKALIDKVKASARAPSVINIPSEKLRKARAAGLLTPLKGKTQEQKEKILKGLVAHGIPLPEGKTSSERKIMDLVRKDMGLPPEPKTPSAKEKYNRALATGLITPLDGKSNAQKEKILQGQANLGLALPEGRTHSEKELISKVKARAMIVEGPPSLPPEQRKKLDQKTAKIMKKGKGPSDECICPQLTPEVDRVSKLAQISIEPGKITSEKLRAAKAAGLLTPLAGKTPAQKEKIVKELLKQGIPLPDAKTASEKKLIDKVRVDLGLPPEPHTDVTKAIYNKARAAGLITPLESKSTAQKEKILRGQAELGLRLPEGRTPSEKSLIAKVKHTTKPPTVIPIPSEKLRKAIAEGLITPLRGKTNEQKEKILKGLVAHGIPLPEGKTSSERKIIDLVRKDMGLPPEPKTPSAKEKYNRALATGLITPLDGKSNAQKEKILQGQANLGLALPEGRSHSERELISKVKARAMIVEGPPSLPPVQRKKLDQKTAKIMKKGKGPSDECICPQLTPEVDRVSKLAQISKEPGKITSEKLRAAKAAGLLTPLAGKSPAQKEKIVKGLLKQGLSLPDAKTASEKILIDKVRVDLGLPPEPHTDITKAIYDKARAAGLITPLESKSTAQKEKILRGQAELGLRLPEGRTPSEKSLIAKVKHTTRPPPVIPIPSEKLRKAIGAGLLTPLKGKPHEQKEKILKGLVEHGIPLPDGNTPSEMKLIDKVRKDLGIPPKPKSSSAKKKYNEAFAAGLITPLEGKTENQKEKILKAQADFGLSLPKGRTSSEKALIDKVKASVKTRSVVHIPSEKLRKAKAAGLITPLTGKTSEQIEKILRGLAVHGIPLPEGKTSSETKLIDKIRKDMGLPPEPKTSSAKDKYKDALAAGIITPLQGKTAAQKEKILKAQADFGVALPEGRTSSEKALIDKVKASAGAQSVVIIPSEKLRKARAAGLLTPLKGKTHKQKEKVLIGLVKHGIPLPDGNTPSEMKLIDKVRKDLGIPPKPKSSSAKKKYNEAFAAGLITPLEGKTENQKEKILKAQADFGLSLPKGRTSSEKALIDKVKTSAKTQSVVHVPSEKLRKAKAAGLITPLTGKTSEQKEKILRGLAVHGIPLPEGKTYSETNLINKIRKDMGLPPEPKTSSAKNKYKDALAAGIITPLQGKTAAQKEKILKAQADFGVALPEGRTSSEKALIDKVKVSARAPSIINIPSEKLRKARAAGLLTPLKGKTLEQKEKILKELVAHGIPLPEGKTSSERKIIDIVRKDVGLPPEPKSPSAKEKYNRALATGLITPLDGKSNAQKEKILQGQANLGVVLPEGRTHSEKELISKVKARAMIVEGPPSLPPAQRKKLDEKTAKIMKKGKGPSDECICPQLTPGIDPEISKEPGKITSEKLRAAKAAGLLTPLAGKTQAQKEKIVKGLLKQGMPLPDAKTASEKKLIDKVRVDLGLPPEPHTDVTKAIYDKARAAGLITPLESKSTAQKEKILRGQAELGLRLPEGRTPSEKSLIAKVKHTTKPPSVIPVPSEKLRKAKAKGLITPLKGKTHEQKEKILKGLAEHGIPLPEPTSASERKVIDKIELERKVRTAAPPGLTQEFEDVIRTTTCDRGCGCDKKKIRFKHSYVKIRVTSPDISSLCPCPEECIPGVKGGVFTDNEGIKVTVGRAIGIPSYSNESNLKINKNKKLQRIYLNKRAVNVETTNTNSDIVNSSDRYDHLEITFANAEAKYEYAIYSTSSSEDNFSHDHIHNESKGLYPCIFTCDSHINPIHKDTDNHDSMENYTSTCFAVDSYAVSVNSQLSRENSNFTPASTTSSSVSTSIVKTESSLSFKSNSYFNDATTISVISFLYSNFSSNVSHNLVSEYSVTFDSDLDYNNVFHPIIDEDRDLNNRQNTEKIKSESYGHYKSSFENYHVIARVYGKHFSNKDINNTAIFRRRFSKNEDPIVILCDLNKDEKREVVEIINNVFEENMIGNKSAICIVFCSSHNMAENITESISVIWLHLSNISHEYNSNVGPIYIKKGPRTTMKTCMSNEKISELKKIIRSQQLPPEPKLPPRSKSQASITQTLKQHGCEKDHFSELEWVDIKGIRKMKSDLTQTTSLSTTKVVL